VLANHPDRTVTDLRRKSVRCLAHSEGSFSHSGASGKPGTLQTVEITDGVHIKLEHPDHILAHSTPIPKQVWMTIEPPAKPSRKVIIHYGHHRDNLLHAINPQHHDDKSVVITNKWLVREFPHPHVPAPATAALANVLFIRTVLLKHVSKLRSLKRSGGISSQPTTKKRVPQKALEHIVRKRLTQLSPLTALMPEDEIPDTLHHVIRPFGFTSLEPGLDENPKNQQFQKRWPIRLAVDSLDTLHILPRTVSTKNPVHGKYLSQRMQILQKAESDEPEIARLMPLFLENIRRTNP
jgi:hypothetical protein